MIQWSNLKVLIVEDDPFLREAITQSLDRLGAKVITAGDGKEAFELLSKNTIDLVISDVQMPVMNGLDLLRNIRKGDPRVPVVLLATGEAQVNEEQAIKEGAVGLIYKPFSLKALKERLLAIESLANF